MENASPTKANNTRTPPIFNTYDVSFVFIPLSIIADTTNGTIKSKHASSILNNGAQNDSFL